MTICLNEWRKSPTRLDSKLKKLSQLGIALFCLFDNCIVIFRYLHFALNQGYFPPVFPLFFDVEGSRFLLTRERTKIIS
ncbi:hypothetical protein PORCRE_2048 [Porphyromonas crevioricanis JCM 15906]|uniref:Uncharacterized protein n=2 Tax=Porphyromonas crevioricanis TaxID=393921 RepID=A0AB34PH25_9PORP|nr:hypothetical protein HQ38_04725 [Porphyromonas crevioricanis]GAD06315.1 hypothetical protein PORCRE_2048 [Porphyromonas crevioricanis JCM 15906]